MPVYPKYRVGNSDRIIGAPAEPANGFVLLNLNNKKCFTVVGGLWAACALIPDPVVVVWNLDSNVPGSIFYIDPIHGNDSNTGTSKTDAWLTTTFSDTLILTTGQKIEYLESGTWFLYRTPGETANMSSITADRVTAGANTF